MYHNFLIHSSASGHLGCFCVLAIVNSASVNIGVHVSFSIIISLGYMPGSGIIGSYGSFQLWMNIHWKDLCWSWSSNTWPPEVKSWLTGKDPDAKKDWRQEEKGMKEDEIVGWHHRLNGHEFGQTPGDGEEQARLACISPWGCKELT